MSEIELVKKEIKKSKIVLRSLLVVLIMAIGTTYAGQVQERFDAGVNGKEATTCAVRVDEVDLYELYKNQVAIIDATTGNRRRVGTVKDTKEEKKLVQAKQYTKNIRK